MSDHYILNGHEVVPATLLEWGAWFEDWSRRRVAHDEANGYRISTVFLGVDHRFGDPGPPLLFETMVFDGNGWTEQWMDRASTWEEAEAMHARGLEWAKEQNRCYRSLLRLVRFLGTVVQRTIRRLLKR